MSWPCYIILFFLVHSPNEAQQLLIGREEETSKCSPNWPPKLASPSRPEERKILTPKGKMDCTFDVLVFHTNFTKFNNK